MSTAAKHQAIVRTKRANHLRRVYSVATYMDVVPNIAMCGVFVEEMGIQGDKYYTMADSPITASTDMGKCRASMRRVSIR